MPKVQQHNYSNTQNDLFRKKLTFFFFLKERLRKITTFVLLYMYEHLHI